MKKCTGLVSLLLLLPSLLFAADLFSLGFGSVNQFQLDILSQNLQQASIVDVQNWATGGELRARVLGVNLDGYLLIQQGQIIDVTEQGKPVFADNISQRLFGMVGLGFSTEVAAFTTLSVAVGPQVGLHISPGFDMQFWAGTKENVFSQDRWKDFLSETALAYRLRLDLNLGGFTIGLHYEAPSSGFSYAQADWARLEPTWKHARIGASFITRFF